MPIDPRIPLGVQAPQIQNPLEVMSTVAQLQAMPAPAVPVMSGLPLAR